jgi:hypothetical protein
LRPEHQPVLLQEPRQPPQPSGEDLLVPVAVDDQLEHAGEDRRGRGRVQLAVDEGRDRRLQVGVVQQVGDGGDDRGRVAGQPLGPPGGGEELPEPARHVDGRELLLDDGAGEEVLLDERAQAGPDLVLLPRDDRRVRDRQPQRVPEQRGDGEPVGERAHHRRLGGGPHVADPGTGRRAEQHAPEEDGGGEQEQAGRQPLHPDQVPQPRRVVERAGEGNGRSGGRHPHQPRRRTCRCPTPRRVSWSSSPG